MKNFLGVLGGMGPAATNDFMAKLIARTPASVDQEHISAMVYGDCSIPDRSMFMMGKGPSPLPQLIEGARFLSQAGASAICIPCNSAHRWFDEMQEASSAPILHIVRASAEQARMKNPQAKRVGVMSTLGTCRAGIYRSTLEELGFEVVENTDSEFESWVNPGIARVKANATEQAAPLFERAAQCLRLRGAEVVILGCTEIPLGMRALCEANPRLYIDSNLALVDAVLAHFQRA